MTVCPVGTHALLTIPMESKNHTSMHFPFDLDMRAFFGLGDPFELWRLVSGSYWKNQLSSPVITRSINSGSASTCSSSSAQTLPRVSHCCSVRFLGTILAQIFLIPNSSVSFRRTASRFTFTSSAITLTQSSIGSNKFSYSYGVVTCPCCWWSFAALLVFNDVSAFRKHFVPVKGLCFWHCIISKGLLKFSMCCGGTATEFNTKKDGIPLSDIPCFHFRDEVRKHVRHLLHNESLQRPVTASRDRGRIKVYGCRCWRAAVLPVQQEKN